MAVKPAGLRIDKRLARAILFEEGAKAAAGYVDPSWIKPIEALSEAAVGKAATHVAFLGTAILAKCVEPRVDVFAIKSRSGPTGYSARTLAKDVLAANAPELDLNLGVTGREPLNNQPYFGNDRLTRNATVRDPRILNMVCDILDRLEASTEEQTRQALRAFIDVRRRYGARYSRAVADRIEVSVPDLVEKIEALVGGASEGGKRAQAVVAGLMDVFAGEDRVDSRRVNDPSRSIPADVNVRAVRGGWERAFEVRDKPVAREDLFHFVRKCLEFEVAEAVMVAIAPNPDMSLVDEARRWAAERGVTLTLFSDWPSLVEQALHWAATPSLEAAAAAPARIEQRLIEVEASEDAVETWQALVGSAESEDEVN
ncbi:MAG TPA: restriction endonuclease, SacI family [Sphingomicrobium sp.]